MSEIDDLNSQLFQNWDPAVAERRDQLMKEQATARDLEARVAIEGLQEQVEKEQVKAAERLANRSATAEDLIWKQ
jgi:hypothetical protein